MKNLKRVNKRLFFDLKEQGGRFVERTGTAVGHQVLSSVLLANTLDVILKNFKEVAFVGNYPEAFFRNFTKGNKS